jgi:hypothetical protein
MLRLFASAVTVVTSAALVGGCATLPPPGTALTSDQRQGAQRDCVLRYTAMGAIGGALLGNMFGGNTRGTATGAAAGGLLTAAIAWGRCFSHYSNISSFPLADARATRSLTGWTPGRGSEVKIQGFSATPDDVRTGSTVNLSGSYYLMAPGDVRDVKVVETRTVSFFDAQQGQWKELGTVDQTVTADLGTRRAEGTFDLPNDVPDGRYRITLKVTALGSSDALSQDITVHKA